MLTTSTPARWQRSTTSRGTPSPATNTEAPPAISASTPGVRSPAAVSRSTPKGRSVDSRTRRISSTSWSLDMVEAPRQPKPPASDTAATRAEYETPPMPASITGCSTPSSSVRRVRMAGRLPAGNITEAGTRPAGERARTGEGVLAPPPGRAQVGAGEVLEHPAGEAAPGPRGGPGRPQPGPHHPRGGRQPLEPLGQRRVSAEVPPDARVVRRRRSGGGERPGGHDGLRRQAPRAEGLAAALARQGVGGGGGVADAQGPAVRGGQRHPADAGGDGPGPVGCARRGSRPQGGAHVGAGQQVGPQAGHGPGRHRTAPQDPEADVGPPAGEGEGPRVAGQEVRFEPD